MKTYTMCGSMRFSEEMKKIAAQLENEKGYNIHQCVYVDDINKLTKEDVKRFQDEHYKKIDNSDGIFVVNINGYIGESVKKEIEYAKNNNKEILYYLEDLQLEFRKPDSSDVDEINAYKEEFIKANSGMDGTGVLIECDAEEWLLTNKVMEKTDNPQYYKYLQYGLFNKKRLLGLIQIRLELKGYLTEFGGHIGYCVRPSERKKGYAKLMLQKALEVCKEIGLNKVLITCLVDNVASAKTIEASGGVFERITFDDKNYKANLKRYWIDTGK